MGSMTTPSWRRWPTCCSPAPACDPRLPISASCGVPASRDAAIRRIQAKWRERRGSLMAAARVRRNSARGPAPVRSRGSGLSTARSGTEEAARQIDELVGGLGFGSGIASELAALSAFRDAVDPPALRRIRELTENPLAKAMRSLEGGFGGWTMREALGVWDSPTMLAARGVEDGTFARAARGIEDNSRSRAMRAHDKAMRDLLG